MGFILMLGLAWFLCWVIASLDGASKAAAEEKRIEIIRKNAEAEREKEKNIREQLKTEIETKAKNFEENILPKNFKIDKKINYIYHKNYSPIIYIDTHAKKCLFTKDFVNYKEFNFNDIFKIELLSVRTDDVNVGGDIVDFLVACDIKEVSSLECLRIEFKDINMENIELFFNLSNMPNGHVLANGIKNSLEKIMQFEEKKENDISNL